MISRVAGGAIELWHERNWRKLRVAFHIVVMNSQL